MIIHPINNPNNRSASFFSLLMIKIKLKMNLIYLFVNYYKSAQPDSLNQIIIAQAKYNKFIKMEVYKDEAPLKKRKTNHSQNIIIIDISEHQENAGKADFKTAQNTVNSSSSGIKSEVGVIKIASKFYASNLEPIVTIALKILLDDQIAMDYVKSFTKIESKCTRIYKELHKTMKYCLKKGCSRLEVYSDLQAIFMLKDLYYSSICISNIKRKVLDTFAKFDSYHLKFDIGEDLKYLNKRASEAMRKALDFRNGNNQASLERRTQSN